MTTAATDDYGDEDVVSDGNYLIFKVTETQAQITQWSSSSYSFIIG